MANSRSEVTDTDLLRAIAEVADPIAGTQDVVDQLTIEEMDAIERLKRLSRNGLIEVEQHSGERGWVLAVPGAITLQRHEES